MKIRFILLFVCCAFFSIGLKAQTVPSFTKKTVDASLDEVYDVFPADLDADGDQDIIAVSRGDGAFWYENDGASNPSFTKNLIDNTTSSQRSVYVVDIDNDKDLDIIIATQIDGFSVGSNVFWYENDGASNPSFTRQTLGLVKGFAYDLDVADIDGDGDLDVAVTDNSGRSSGFSAEDVTWFENNGAADPTFTKNLIDTDFRFAETVKIGDIDGDGDLDIVVGSDYLDDIVWYENNGAANPSFSKNYADQNALGVDGIDLADIDNDGDLDIVFADFFSDYIAWLRNNGAANPSFSEVRIESYNAIGLVEVGDIDLDGDLDIFSGSLLEDNLFWYESDGLASPTFTKHIIATSVDQPETISIADINGDGSPDFVAGIFRADDVLWFESDMVTVNPRSISLDGVNDFINLPDNIASVLGNGSDLTMEAWIKPDYINQTQSLAALFGINTSSGYNTIILTLDNAASENAGKIRVLDGVGNTNNYEITSPQITNNKWLHIAYTLKGTTGTLYFDGEEIGQHTQDRPLASDDLWSFGQEYDTGSSKGNYAQVIVDEIRIWNDARTQQEIRANMFQSLKGDETGLVGYWALDEENSVLAFDKTSNNNNATLESGATRSKENSPYGTFITGNEGWRMLSIPASGVSYGEILDTLWTQGFTGSDSPTIGSSNVLVWDESTRAFSSITNATAVPAVSSGFIAYVYDDNNYDGTGDGFPKMIKTDSTQRTGTVTPSLSFTNTEVLANDGWNLVGNPYGATIDWDISNGMTATNLDASFYVWSDSANSGAGAYLTWNGSAGTFGGGEIAPWQGFWVKANAASPALSLNNEIRSGGGILRKKAPVSQLGFTLKGRTLSSQTVMMFSDNAALEKDALDAYKLQSLNATYLSLFSKLDNGSSLDINALPKAIEAPISIPLDFTSHDMSGEYTLSWNPSNLPDGMTLTLEDSENGTEIDLSKASSYRFEMDSETNAKAVKEQELVSPQHKVISPTVMKAKSTGSRFTIQINAETSVSNEPVADLPNTVELNQNYPNPFNPSTTIAFGVPQTGNVILEVFDVLGRKVATLLDGENRAAGRYSVHFDARNLSSGMYIYRLRAGNSVITKKLTLIK